MKTFYTVHGAALASLLMLAGCTGKSTSPVSNSHAAEPPRGSVKSFVRTSRAKEPQPATFARMESSNEKVTAAAPSAQTIAAWTQRLRAALYQLSRCPREPGELAVSDTNCLIALSKASHRMKQAGEHSTVRNAHASVLLNALSHGNETVVYYALKWNGDVLGALDGPRHRSRLTLLMKHRRSEIRAFAARVRFFWRDENDAETLQLAKTMLVDKARQTEVRVRACEYLGDPIFSNHRDHYELLLKTAGVASHPPRLRQCAVRRLCRVGNTRDIRRVAAFLPDTAVQYDAVQCLREFRKYEAHSAYVRFFYFNAKRPGSLNLESIRAAPPGPNIPRDEYPAGLARTAFYRLVLDPKMSISHRLHAVGSLRDLVGIKELAIAKVRLAVRRDDPSLRKAVDQALYVAKRY